MRAELRKAGCSVISDPLPQIQTFAVVVQAGEVFLAGHGDRAQRGLVQRAFIAGFGLEGHRVLGSSGF